MGAMLGMVLVVGCCSVIYRRLVTNTMWISIRRMSFLPIMTSARLHISNMAGPKPISTYQSGRYASGLRRRRGRRHPRWRRRGRLGYSWNRRRECRGFDTDGGCVRGREGWTQCGLLHRQVGSGRELVIQIEEI